MTRKQKEANMRRALAAGRRRRSMPESSGTSPFHGESVAPAGSVEALDDVEKASVPGQLDA